MTKKNTLILVSIIAVFFFGMYVQNYFNPPTTAVINTPSDEDEAKGVLITFLSSLYEKEYATAAAVYGGNYSQLQEWNLTVNPTDLALLWQKGCEINGLNCLEIRNMVFVSQPDQNTFNFNVWFSNSDKITELSLPNGTSMFLFTVVKNSDGQYLVTTMPIYTP